MVTETLRLLCTVWMAAGASDAHTLLPSDSLTKVLRNAAPAVADGGAILRIDGAAGETVSAQAVLLAGRADTVAAAISDLRNAEGTSKIPANAACLQWVRYVEIPKNSAGVPADELIGRAPLAIPDPFWEDAERPVEAKSVTPLWIELALPADTPAGDFRGTLTVTGRDGRTELPLLVHVRGFRLPEARHQNVIQWWDFPGRGFEQLKPGTDEYYKHLERSCEFVRRHRQTDVSVAWSTIASRPAGEDGKKWDTSLFERYAETVFNAGLRAVHLNGLGGHTVSQTLPNSRTQVGEESLARLAALQELVVEKGWQGRVFTSIADEPFIYNERSYRAVLDRVRKIAPAVGVVEAVESEDLGDLDIYVPKLSHLNLWWPRFEDLERQHKEVWFYTCCHPVGRYPNRFLDQPLIGVRELHWIAYLHGLQGYLHWGLNRFAATGDPYSAEAAHYLQWPPGDAQVAYPGRQGFLGSQRLSVMRDGLQDYEYLWTLEDRLRTLKQGLGEEARWLDPRQRPLELCRRVVQSCYERTRDPKVLFATRAALADEIDAMSVKPLLVVQTSPPEGSVTPAGPTMINVRGVTTPGAKVTVNGRAVIPENISAGGCFIDAQFITADKSEIVVTAELDGRVCTVKRSFKVVE